MNKDNGGGEVNVEGLGRAGESNGGKMGTTVIEQQFKKKKFLKRPLGGKTVSSEQSALGAAKRINPPTVTCEGSGGNPKRLDSERKERN